MMATLQELEARLDRLEREVAALKAVVKLPPTTEPPTPE